MITIDWGTHIITIPQSYLAFVSGTFYTLDTNQFRLDLKALEVTPEGMAEPITHRHNTEVTIAGTTFARTIEILAPYSVEFEDGQYSVQLQNSNNNIWDIGGGILVQNQVQVIPTNSAGLIIGSGGTGGSTWTNPEKKQIRDALGVDGDKAVAKGGQLQQKSEYPNNSTVNTQTINSNDL